MDNKSKLPKDVKEQIQSLASDVYIQIEDKLTKLISSAIETSTHKDVGQQKGDYFALEKSYKTCQLELSKQIDSFSNKKQSLEQEIDSLKSLLVDKQNDLESNKQNFQVELTQNTINFNETIEGLERKLIKFQQEKTLQQSPQRENGDQLEEKLLETEQALKDSKTEVDGLNGRIAVLTGQERSLLKQLGTLKDLHNKDNHKFKAATDMLQQKNQEQSEALINKQHKLEDITEKLNKSTAELENTQKENKQANDSQVQETHTQLKRVTAQLQQEQESKVSLKEEFSEQLNKMKEQKEQEAQRQLEKMTEKLQQEQETKVVVKKEFMEQLQQEKSHKIILQQDLTALQKNIDIQQDKSQQLETKNQVKQEKIIELTEHLDTEQQKHVKEKEAASAQEKEANKVQEAAQVAIIQLEKDKEQLTKQIETEQSDVKLYQQEVTALKEQVTIAQEGQENILQRFNSNREKQEKDNEKVRETIKFLRDENHNLLSAQAEQNNQLTEKIHDLEHRVTEYRLKFEYAQKQLSN